MAARNLHMFRSFGFLLGQRAPIRLIVLPGGAPVKPPAARPLA
jgi:hypothetical protein